MSRQKEVHHGTLEMADIFRSYGTAYRQKYWQRMLPSHLRAMNDIEKYRTAELGGQVYKCPDHDEMEYSYHSCMNRHCPKCKNVQAQKWLIKERKKLLPVLYFFATFIFPRNYVHLLALTKLRFTTLYFALPGWQCKRWQKTLNFWELKSAVLECCISGQKIGFSPARPLPGAQRRANR